MSHSPESFAKLTKQQIDDILYDGIEDDMRKVCTVRSYRAFKEIYDEGQKYYTWFGKLWSCIFGNEFKKSFEEFFKGRYESYKDESWSSDWYRHSDTNEYCGFIRKIKNLSKYSNDFVFMCDEDVATLDYVKRKSALMKTQEFIADYEKYKPLYAIWHCK
jgi:hypothetical protein